MVTNHSLPPASPPEVIALSTAVSAFDVCDPSDKALSQPVQNGHNQISFSDEASDCDAYKRHAYASVMKAKSRVCTSCGRDIAKHRRGQVSEEDIRVALSGGPKKSSLILEGEDGMGGLYLGGYLPAVQEKELVDHKIGFVVNATGTNFFSFQPTFKPKRDRLYERLRIQVSDELDWVDDASQPIDLAQLREVCFAMNEARSGEKSGVLVHCAQGKSRSTTVVLAYLRMFGPDDVRRLELRDALARVREKHVMAQPNEGFMEQLTGLWELEHGEEVEKPQAG
ncbi:hypothetical protein TrRE_jg1824 [Triparma retinervis]|uniref:protein-tyrosine-phosphatase n=1 Tax=Triparma retinervis TaxID=2557542 RepID=A0A9W7EC17_9STRA|nr:hypothetical protein TrRE_jg1824 [Triparma retinervis]